MTTFQRPEYLDADGALLAYFVSGRGKVPVVWLHGLPLDSRSWSAQRAHFDPLARNVFADLRGYGASSRLPADCADVTQLYTDDLDRLLTHLDLREVTLIGLRLSGTHRTALRRPASTPTGQTRRDQRITALSQEHRLAVGIR